MSPDNRLNDLNGSEWIKRTLSWFTLTVRRRKARELLHPGKFPEELAARFISFFTKKNQWVIDPFLGVGSTLVACKQLQRNGVGIEINDEFVATAKDVLDSTSSAKPLELDIIEANALEIDQVLKTSYDDVPQFQLCMTSPPYWNMLAKHRGGSKSQHRDRKEKGLPLVYSSDIKDDISNIVDYKDYLDAVMKVFVKMKEFLSEKAHVVVVLQNIRAETGEFVPIAWDFARVMQSHFKVLQEQVWCQTDKRTGIWGYPSTYVSNVHHHYCLVFQNS
jgi:DNA modification methylase